MVKIPHLCGRMHQKQKNLYRKEVLIITASLGTEILKVVSNFKA